MKAGHVTIISNTSPTNSKYLVLFFPYNQIYRYKSLAYLDSVTIQPHCSCSFLLLLLWSYQILFSYSIMLCFLKKFFYMELLYPFNGSWKNSPYLFIDKAPHEPVLT